MLPHQLYLTDNEAPMTAQQTEAHQTSISVISEQIDQTPGDLNLLMRRALDYYHIRDFEDAVADMNAFIQEADNESQTTTDVALAFILRAQCRFAQLEVSRTTASASDLRLGYLMAVQDYYPRRCPAACGAAG